MLRLIEKWLRAAIDETVDRALARVVRDEYPESIGEMVGALRKVGGLNALEITMRAAQGAPAPRPLGSPLRLSPWDKLLFNPVHLCRFPTPENVPIDTAVTIGPRARRPLTVAIPVLIAGMSFGGALSKRAKIALARAATAVGTATNTGEAPLLEEERAAARLLIGQYNRGGWLNRPEQYRRVDAIEIQPGQGAQGSTPQRTSARNIGPDFRAAFGLEPGQDAVIHSRLPGVNSQADFIRLVRRLRAETGVPVGVKLAATHHLERELAVALEAGVDFVTVDGAEGGTHGGAPTLQDDVGLPTLYAVARARDFLVRQKAAGDVSLIAAGGLITPGQMLKAMALGADAVYTGTAALMTLIGEQAAEALPFEPPTSLVVYTGKRTGELDVDRAARSLQRFLNACVREMEMVAVTLGRTALSEIGRSDLCTLDPVLARATGVQLGLVAPDRQHRLFPEVAPDRRLPGWAEPPGPPAAEPFSAEPVH
ncbi:FMN-binding glutamate synthase family protein [Symbiobacterium thermophilum]|uniref:Glutamate synthetase n=1 Tax=Symbiobacterium thermophilum (strain DSM 24528 / JCM 14929 / IAM 14863 / T) TaxID=292459 RepID=Q67QX8_SYMTH|nr:FMN-binding glutamate synthase family protein [Symbiobacterium thermophilum]BAD39915.1 glutamate synthetase [Symbiobacterium thermophilum IAM 14863]